MESHEKKDGAIGLKTLDVTTLASDTKPVENGNPRHGKLQNLDDLFPYIGHFGWYQRILFLLMIPYSFFFAFVYFAQIFMTVAPAQHWCMVEELATLDVEDRRHLSIPQTQDGYSKCLVYDVDWKSVLQDGVTEPNSTWPIKKCEGKWEFNFTDVPYETIATELGWVCDKDEYPATAQAVFFCGAILGGLIFGWVADKYGRVPALVGTNMAGFLAGVGTAFSNSFWSFCLCRFLVGLAYDNCFVIMYIVVVEYVGPKWRTFVANMSIAVYFTFAACLLPWIALAVADWKIYTLITSVPLALAIFTPWVVPESARWLISKGRIDQAMTILSKFERINGTKIPDHIAKEFRETATAIAKEDAETRNYSILDLFRTPRLRRHSILLLLIWMSIAMVFDGHVRNVGSLGLDIFLTFTVATATEFPADVLLVLLLDRHSILLLLIWMSIAMVFDGHVRNVGSLGLDIFLTFTVATATEFPADVLLVLLLDRILLLLIWMSIAMVFDGHVRNVGSLGLDIFLTFTVATATEFPADVLLVLLLDRVGRRWLAFGSMALSGVFSFLACTVPMGIPSASLAIIGRFAVNISFNIGMQYAAELLPTVVRAQGLALIHITGYVATILVPYIVYMATIAAEIPLLILGALGLIGGFLCLFLPESMGKRMPTTIQDGEDYGREQKFWNFPCCSKSTAEDD